MPVIYKHILLIYQFILPPYKNSIVVPDYPYVIHGTQNQQFENIICPELDNTFFAMYSTAEAS